MKQAILVFTKVPKIGDCKTRLTEARGGILTPAEATALYEACLLDVLDACLSVGVDVWVCYNRGGDRSYLEYLLTKLKHPEKITGVFSDQGGSFDDCMQYAADYILRSGADDRLADCVLISGGDLPCLQPYTLRDALIKLEALSSSEAGRQAAAKKVKDSKGNLIGAAVVEGACQEGGFSLVGLTCTTDFDFYSVFYNINGITALDMLVNKVRAKNIPIGFVEEVPDLDIPVDLASVIPMLRVIELAAQYDPSVMVPRRVIGYLDEIGVQSMALPPVSDYGGAVIN